MRLVRSLDGGAHSKLRGFATNVANYQILGEPCPAHAFAALEGSSLGGAYCDRAGLRGSGCCVDPCGLLGQFNNANNELNYAQFLASRVSRIIPDWSVRFIIDTGRNGVSGAVRTSCANWCNIRGAGLGAEPTSSTALPNLVDAYFWLKTPGESDGCTQILPDGSRCPRFDRMCESVDSIGSRSGEPRAPEAGSWWVPQLAELTCRGNIDQGGGGGGGGESGGGCSSKAAAAAIEQGETLFFPSPPQERASPPQARMHTVSSQTMLKRHPRPPPPPPHAELLIQGNLEIPRGASPPPPETDAFSMSALVSFVHLIVVGGLCLLTRGLWQPALRKQLGDERYDAIVGALEAAKQRTSDGARSGLELFSMLASRCVAASRVKLGRALISLGQAAAAGAQPAGEDCEEGVERVVSTPSSKVPLRIAASRRSAPSRAVGPASSRRVKFGAVPTVVACENDENSGGESGDDLESRDGASQGSASSRPRTAMTASRELPRARESHTSNHRDDEDGDAKRRADPDGLRFQSKSNAAAGVLMASGERKAASDEGLRFGGSRGHKYDNGNDGEWGEEEDEEEDEDEDEEEEGDENEIEDSNEEEDDTVAREKRPAALRFGGKKSLEWDGDPSAPQQQKRLHRVEKALAVLKGQEDGSEQPVSAQTRPAWPGPRTPANAEAMARMTNKAVGIGGETDRGWRGQPQSTQPQGSKKQQASDLVSTTRRGAL